MHIERYRETERQRNRETERETERERQRKTERETERETERQRLKKCYHFFPTYLFRAHTVQNIEFVSIHFSFSIPFALQEVQAVFIFAPFCARMIIINK